MPLSIDNGITITPRPDAPETVTPGELLLPLDGGVPVAGQPKVLSIAPVRQAQRKWCWAACVEMLLNHFQRHQDQCSIVGRKRDEVLPEVCCGVNEADFENEGCEPLVMRDVWMKFNISAEAHLATNGTPGRLTFDEIKTEINAERPVEVGIKWNDDIGGGHAVIIKGWDSINGEDAVWVNDPWPQSKLSFQGIEGKVRLDELRRANNNGKWLHTWAKFADLTAQE
jgi:hypothetical protein